MENARSPASMSSGQFTSPLTWVVRRSRNESGDQSASIDPGLAMSTTGAGTDRLDSTGGWGEATPLARSPLHRAG